MVTSVPSAEIRRHDRAQYSRLDGRRAESLPIVVVAPPEDADDSRPARKRYEPIGEKSDDLGRKSRHHRRHSRSRVSVLDENVRQAPDIKSTQATQQNGVFERHRGSLTRAHSAALPTDCPPLRATRRISSSHDLSGFSIGDKVTPPPGPWAGLGEGTVIGFDTRPGMLDVEFGNGEQFSIRAKALREAASKKETAPLPRAIDPWELEGWQLAIGDVVTFEGQGRGILQDAGPSPGTALVNMGMTGTKVLRIDKLSKVMTSADYARHMETRSIEGLFRERKQNYRDLPQLLSQGTLPNLRRSTVTF